MASFPIPGATTQRLDSPPPSSGVPQPTLAGLTSGLQAPTPQDAMAAAQPSVPQEALSGVLQVGQQIDQAILSLASSVPAGSKEFSQARDLIKRGLAKFLESASTTAPPSVSGPGFPSGTSTGQ